MDKQSMPAVTLEQLKTGERARINEHQLSTLTGRSVHSARRDRVKGLGAKFQKDPVTGRVFYRAEDVLEYLDQPVHRSTSEYSTSSQIANLEKARRAQKKTSS